MKKQCVSFLIKYAQSGMVAPRILLLPFQLSNLLTFQLYELYTSSVCPAIVSHENTVSTAWRPLRPIQRACSKLVNSVPMPQATDSGVGHILYPVTSCHTISDGPPIDVATTGFPAAQASST